MRRCIVLVAVLTLFLIPLLNPSLYIDSYTIVDDPFEVQEIPFLTAADGDVSSESIGEDYSHKFRETLSEDVLFFPDTFHNDTIVLASSGTAGPSEAYDYTYTHKFQEEPSRWYYGHGGETSYVIINFTVPTGDYVIDGFDYAIHCVNGPDEDDGDFLIYDWTSNDWVDFGDVENFGFGSWHNDTIYDPDYWSTQVSLKVNATETGGLATAYIDYSELTFYIMTLADSEHYAESFSSVSDWTLVGNEGADSLASDGDVATFVCEWNGGTDYDNIQTNGPSVVAGTYAEIRARRNASLAWVAIKFYSEDDVGGSSHEESLWGLSTTSFTTIRWLMPYDVESIRIYGMTTSADGQLEIDYLRIAPADEMGFSHDCSTTAGINELDSGNHWTQSTSSDGNVVTLTGSRDSTGSGWGKWGFVFDTTTTAADLKGNYYPFGDLYFRVTSLTGCYINLVWYIENYRYSHSIATGTTSWAHYRTNNKANDVYDASTGKMEIQIIGSDVGSAATIEVDFAQAYSIANFTYTDSGIGTDDYLYVDSGVLHSHIDDGYIELNHDPALSVSDTYSVYNLTTSGTAPEFSQYVSSWSSYSDDTRGATTSGTVTDIKLKFDSIESISAIKFIEDGTAPSVLRISATPPEPDDTESVTLSALATDTVEVYKVWFRPITGPTGYSQTDYESTEQADNLWTYEFSSLDEGYWAFKAIANDGANNSTLDADSVTDFWVREKELIISNTLYTETSTQCSFAGQTNVACDYIIYDDDAEQESGNKAAGSFFLDWTKQTSVGTHDWGIKFYTASDTDWHNGSYEVLTTTLLVTEYGIRTTTSYAYLHGYVNLDSNYTVYEETVEVGTGSVSAGSFEIRWTKASSSVENVTALFESGSQTYPVYSGYDVAEQTTFVVEQWWVSLQIGLESYVEFYAHTSWENATIYVYDNTTLMVIVSELAGGASSNFWMSKVQGLHTITLNITHGATVHTRTRTYYIPDWAATGLVVRWDLWTFQDNYTMLELGSNWMNCTYYVYLNSSLVATSANDPVTLNFTRAINIGAYNLTIYADGGTQTYTIKNIRYIITEEGVSYDYSTVTGGYSVIHRDTYEGDTYEGDTHENPPGIYMTAETAATIAVSTVFIFFLAVLFMNSRVKKAQLDIDKKGNQ